MKQQSEAIMQYSGYPLTIADLKQKQKALSVVKLTAYKHTTTIQKNKISNDPVNWDEGWFNHYE